MPYTKYYKGTALLAKTNYYAPYKYVDFNLTAAYVYTSATTQKSFAFKTIGDYNIHEVLASYDICLSRPV